MPTENGAALHKGRTPRDDAAVVRMLRAAGAVILGKTVTTECAYFNPGKTRNPHNPEHTPGGSSSGSAAAVGAGMVPLALGSQTAGSVIRPAAFCGAHGFKPTHGLIPRTGILQLSRTLDHVGLFSRAASKTSPCCSSNSQGYDERDPDTRPRARLPFQKLSRRRTAGRADARVRQDAALGAHRRRHQGGVSGAGGNPGKAGGGSGALSVGRRRLGLAPHDHGSRDGGEPRAAVARWAGEAFETATRH